MHPTLTEIDQIRQSGFRPQIVGCIISNNKILFVYKEKYKLWQLPQGGIDNGEDVEKATFREMIEELGKNFVSSFKINSIIDKDKLIFPKQNQGSRELKTDTGKSIFMIGKKYFFVPIATNNKNLDITDTEFDNYTWLNYKEATNLAKKIYQKGKQQTTLKALESLRKQNLL